MHFFMIKLKNINKSYVMGQNSLHVLKGIDLHIKAGEMVSIMGSSGSGKSTLLNILGILDNYDNGEYQLNGTLIKDLNETKAARYRNEMIGFVFRFMTYLEIHHHRVFEFPIRVFLFEDTFLIIPLIV